MPLLRWLRLPAVLLLMAILLVLSALHKHYSYDEMDNLAYGYRFLVEGPGAPPNGQRMPVLALNALACAEDGCRMEPLGSELRRFLTRAPTALFALLLAVAVFRWAGELFGSGAAWLSVLLVALNPSVLAHGKQITSDVATTFFTAATVYAFWRLARRPSARALVACALALVGALAAKFTSLLLLPVLAMLTAYEWWRGGPLAQASGRRRAAAVAAFALAVLVGLNAVYLFDGTLRAASSYEWKSRALSSLADVPLPIPLPKVFTLGLDHSSYLQEHPEVGRGHNYVLGELNRDGRWYAFPLMLLLKTPLAFFVLLGLAVAARPPTGAAERGDSLAYLWLPFAVVFAFFSLFVDPQLGIRYVLPAVPFLIVFAGRAVSFATSRPRRALLAVLVLWHAASTLSYHPHYMPYFNELIGSRLNAYRYLADSNLDWEDRSWFIGWFRIRRPDLEVKVRPERPTAGYVLVGANDLVGVIDPEAFRWLRENFRPIGHVGYSWLLFYVPPERLAEIEAEGRR